MNILQKLFWRLKVIFFESWGKDWRMIKFSLLPADKRNASALVKFLENSGIIKIDRKNSYFKFRDNVFYYDSQAGEDGLGSVIADFVSIYSSQDDYFRKNFINSSSYFFEGPYELDKVKINAGDFVIDAGANIGIFSVLAASKVGQSGKVFAFEPIDCARSILEKNIKANKLSNVEIMPIALGAKLGPIEFSVPRITGNSSGYVISDSPKHIVDQTTVDDLIKTNKISRIDFIKADIEGMERDLLIGAEETIKKYKPKVAICSYHRSDDPEVISNLLKEFVPAYRFKITKTKIYASI